MTTAAAGPSALRTAARAAALAVPVLTAGWLPRRRGWGEARVRAEVLLSLVCAQLQAGEVAPAELARRVVPEGTPW